MPHSLAPLPKDRDRFMKYTSAQQIYANSLGDAWLKLIRETKNHGEEINNEIIELRNLSVTIEKIDIDDPVLSGAEQQNHIAEMKKVFFGEGDNYFGHSYSRFIRGPRGKLDYSDVISCLKTSKNTKKAAVILDGQGEMVPCLLAVHFMIRYDELHTTYFSRGQDIFNKYYADCIAVAEMSRLVSIGLSIPVGPQYGFISSAHIYLTDLRRIDEFLFTNENKQ